MSCTPARFDVKTPGCSCESTRAQPRDSLAYRQHRSLRLSPRRPRGGGRGPTRTYQTHVLGTRQPPPDSSPRPQRHRGEPTTVSALRGGRHYGANPWSPPIELDGPPPDGPVKTGNCACKDCGVPNFAKSGDSLRSPEKP